MSQKKAGRSLPYSYSTWGQTGTYEAKYVTDQDWVWLQAEEGQYGGQVPANANEVELGYVEVMTPDPGVGSWVKGDLVVKTVTAPGIYSGTAVIQMRQNIMGAPSIYRSVRQKISWAVEIKGEGDRQTAKMFFKVEELLLNPLEQGNVTLVATPLRMISHPFKGTVNSLPYPDEANSLPRDPNNLEQPANPPAGWNTLIPNPFWE